MGRKEDRDDNRKKGFEIHCFWSLQEDVVKAHLCVGVWFVGKCYTSLKGCGLFSNVKNVEPLADKVWLYIYIYILFRVSVVVAVQLCIRTVALKQNFSVGPNSGLTFLSFPRSLTLGWGEGVRGRKVDLSARVDETVSGESG